MKSRLSKVLPYVSFVTMIAALYAAFLYAPTERTMGDLQRIFYFHVSAWWIAFLAFGVVFRCQRGISPDTESTLRRRSPRFCGSRRRVLHDRSSYGTDMGETCVGHLLDLGCQTDNSFGLVAPLRGLCHAAWVHSKPIKKGEPRCRRRNRWRCRYSHRHFFYSLVADAASSTGDHGRFRFRTPSPHVAGSHRLYAGLFFPLHSAVSKENCIRGDATGDRCTLEQVGDRVNYLVAACIAMWAILSLYLFSMSSRLRRLEREIKIQKQVIQSRESSKPDNSVSIKTSPSPQA